MLLYVPVMWSIVLQAKTFFSEGIAAEQRGNHYQGMSVLPSVLSP